MIPPPNTTEVIELLNPSFEDFKKAHEGITTANPLLHFKNTINGRTFERVVYWDGFPLRHEEVRKRDIADQWEAHQASLERTKRRVAA